MKIKTNLKGFTAYTTNSALNALLRYRKDINEKLRVHEAQDPTGSTWGTIGFHATGKDEWDDPEFVRDLDGKAMQLLVQFNDRICPAATIKERMAEELAAIKTREGRKANKTEFAQIRDVAEAYLLPRSHIRRTVIPVFVYPTHIVIFSTSAKRAGDVISRLFGLMQDLGQELHARPAEGNESSAAWITAVAKSDDDSPLEPGSSAVLRYDGEEKKSAIRIKDKDICSGDVQSLIGEDNYRVSELEVSVLDGAGVPAGVAGVQFTINDKLVIKGLRFPDLTIQSHVGAADGDAEAEALAIFTLVAMVIPQILKIVFDSLGGEARATYDAEDEL